MTWKGSRIPETVTDIRTVTSLLSSCPMIATCFVPSLSMVHSLTGTNLEPVWSQLIMRACGMFHVSTSLLTLRRNACFTSGKSLGNLRAALVTLFFTHPILQRNDSAQVELRQIGPPCSFRSPGFLWDKILLTAATATVSLFSLHASSFSTHVRNVGEKSVAWHSQKTPSL